MEIYLSRNHQTCLHLFPLSVGRFQGVFNRSNGPDGQPPQLVVERFIGPVEALERKLKGMALRSLSDLSQLNELVERVERLGERDREIFSGALDIEAFNGVADVLRVVQNTGNYELIDGITSERALGRWLVEAGRLTIRFPEDVPPYLDYDVIGSVYHSTHGGVFTPEGYVQRREGIPKLEKDALISLTLATTEQSDTLFLPASEEQLADAERVLGDLNMAVIASLEFKLPYLKHLVPTDHVTVEEAKALADCLQGMVAEEDALLKYCSVLAVEEPAAFSEALTIAMDIDDYERVPEDMDEYGRRVLRRAGADDEVLDTIDGYMDFARLGTDSLVEDGVRQTEYGLVRRLSNPFPAEEIGQTMS